MLRNVTIFVVGCEIPYERRQLADARWSGRTEGMMKTLVRAGIATAAVLALATGCSDEGDAGTTAANAVKSAQAQAPATAAPPVSEPAGSDAAPAADAPDSGTTPVLDTQPPSPEPGNDAAGNPCLDTSSDLVQNVIARMGPPPGSDYYAIGEHTTATTPNCPALMWAFAETPRGTGSSPENIMFFHDGRFVRMATPSPSAFTSIVSSSDDSLTVHYSWIVGDEPNASPQGNVDVTFLWDGSNMVTDREIPEQVYTFG